MDLDVVTVLNRSCCIVNQQRHALHVSMLMLGPILQYVNIGYLDFSVQIQGWIQGWYTCCKGTSEEFDRKI